jgi:site-specific recombinase XerD
MRADHLEQHPDEIARSVECNGSTTSEINPGAGIFDCTECMATMENAFGAINCTDHRRIPASSPSFPWESRSSPFPAPPVAVRQFVNQSLSENTKRGYKADLAHFASTGRTIPSTPEIVAEYLAEGVGVCAVATMQRRLAAIAKAHVAMGADDPTKIAIVQATMRGIRRTLGVAQREAKPVLREDLFAMLERMGSRTKDIRDKALLLLGFAGAFRRSELVGLDIADIEHARQGIIITLRRSKTDQTGAGRKIGIPFGRTRWCPVKYLTDWLDQAGIESGPIFRVISRHGHVADQRLSGEAVSIIVKERAKAAGFDPDAYSGHSLRAGLATSRDCWRQHAVDPPHYRPRLRRNALQICQDWRHLHRQCGGSGSVTEGKRIGGLSS